MHPVRCRLMVAYLIAPALGSVAARTAQAEELRLPAGDVIADHGALVGAVNRLTGEVYTLRPVPGLDTGLLRSRTEALWSAEGQSVSTEPSPGGVESRAAWEGGELRTRFTLDAPAGDLLVSQQGSAEGGLYGCQWALRGLDDERVSVIVPAWSGVCLDRDAPVTDVVLDWPSVWEARVVIVQGEKGGLSIRADDPDDRFKGLAIRHQQGRFDLGFRTYNEGPPAGHPSVESVTWRVTFYEGDWRVPARRCREWMAETFGLTPLRDRRPTWAADIRSVVILDTDRDPARRDEVRATLRKLMEWVTPAKCLLYVPNWRRDVYDINYPDYAGYKGFADLVAYARELGYRVMPHTCYYGVNLENPDYEALKPYHMRDAVSGELHTYVWP
ncbi:MAG: hypothetical protein FJX74_21620, partial [Armatimonadetes bacterium]|nr:hypothetical protein [Armatimonadota bacterium]